MTAGLSTYRSVGAGPVRAAYRIGWVLAVVTLAAAVPTLLVPGILTGPAAMNGSARGTALVAGVIAVPVLVVAMTRAAAGSARAVVVWLGVAGYLLYNATLFVFATPFNQLFLLYVAMLALSLWSVLLVAREWEGLAGRVAPGLPARGIATYILVVAGLNLVVWLRTVIPAMLDERPTDFLADYGLPTSPLFVQDLGWWLPLAVVIAIWSWRRTPRGLVLMGALLTMWEIEAVGVATDQAFGHAADPGSSVASLGGAGLFAGLAVVGAVPLAVYFRGRW